VKRKTPLRAKGKSRFPKRRNADYLAWISTLPCLLLHRGEVCRVTVEQLPDGRWRRSDPAHIKSRGAGGDDIGNTIPLCQRHHREQHDIGITSFAEKYGLDLTDEATRLAAEWTAHHGA